MQLTPLNERHTTNAFSLYVFRQQKHGSNGTLVVILNCFEHPSHIVKKQPVRGEAVDILIFYFTKLATSREHYICLLFISSFGPYTFIFSASEINSFRKSKLFKFVVIIYLTHSTGEDLDL